MTTIQRAASTSASDDDRDAIAARAAQRERYLAMDLLRFITCGSVDDGKSTLIGRLLCDTKSIHQDQWEAVHRTSLQRGDARVDLALLTDGLRAEREQGITIDVAHRYFSTPRRKFILADTPGHVQYTRNMVTGASNAELALILVDARQGILEQTRRHAYLVALLGIRRLVLCVNKMDLVGWDESAFRRIVGSFEEFTGKAGRAGSVFEGVRTVAIPMSALLGDNVVLRSDAAPWYSGPPLLEVLETVPVDAAGALPAARLFVQWVIRPHSDAHHDHRGYAGRVAAGTFAVGQEVVALPGGQRSRIARIELDGPIDSCRAPQSVALHLADDIDLGRGDLLVAAAAEGAEAHPPRVVRSLDATLVWMHESPLLPGRRVVVKHGARYVKAIIAALHHRLDVHTLEFEPAPRRLELNDIGRVGLSLSAAIACDAYADCRETGSFIVIDEATNATLAGGMIEGRHGGKAL
ncbi:MAG TPA: GTP-binding protein [Phycisphaerales bacterium]|nr:GTP-binding protein [Phycisphaerales bacterium]HMP38030.1 GTP-binding protein [Phycisphaerales bacterium]